MKCLQCWLKLQFDAELMNVGPTFRADFYASAGVLFSGCQSVRASVHDHISKVCDTISYKPFVGISPNLQLGCSVRDKDELLRFFLRLKLKSKGHSEIKYIEETFWGHFLTHLRSA